MIFMLTEDLGDCAGRPQDVKGATGRIIPKVPDGTGGARGEPVTMMSILSALAQISFQVKHSRAHAQMLRSAIAALKAEL